MPNCGASFVTNQLAMNPTTMRNPLKTRAIMATDFQLSHSRPLLCRARIDLVVVQLCGDCPHSSVDIIAPLPRRKQLKLGGKISLPLLRENRSIDRPAGPVPMTSGTWRNVPARIAQFDQLNDGIWRSERSRIRIAHRLAGV